MVSVKAPFMRVSHNSSKSICTSALRGCEIEACPFVEPPRFNHFSLLEMKKTGEFQLVRPAGRRIVAKVTVVL